MENNCKICGSFSLNLLYPREMMFGTREQFNYAHCMNCDTIQFCDFDKDIQNGYTSNYYSFRDTAVSWKERFRSYIYYISVKGVFNKFLFFNKIAAKIFDEKSAYAISGIIENSGTILDIGCGNGDFIYALSKIYKEKVFVGIDPFIPQSKDRGLNCAIFQEDGLSHFGRYDLILLNHSFEHMENPYEICSKLGELLNPGGIVCIRIPVCDSYFYYKYGINWVQLDAPRHKFIYSNNSLEFLLRKCNLRIVESYSDSRTFSYMASEMYKNDIALTDSNSFFQNRISQFFKRTYWKCLSKGNVIVDRMNKMNFGDQRVYIIKKL